MNNDHARILVGAALLLVALAWGVRVSMPPDHQSQHGDRIVIDYWEKWSDFEMEAMRDIVDLYNESQEEVWVNYLSVGGQIDQKLLLATAGGNPPDVAGLWAWRLYTYADMGALEPLDGYMRRDGLTRGDYLPSVIGQCEYRGFVWGLPATPATLALHLNRELFRAAGLDPDRPPRSIAELDAMAERLTLRDDDGNIVQLGFMPTEPGWWNDRWSYWFGARLLSDAGDELTIDSPENLAAFEWIRSYSERYGFKDLSSFQSTGGEFSSAQNLFLAGKVAMVMQGVWMATFVDKFSPGLDYGVAPFPSVDADMEPVTICEADVLVIPRGSRHPDAAWDFIRFVQRRENMERLCLGQRKFSPLAEVSPSFGERHPNPHIATFRRLAESPNARSIPKTALYSEYRDEINNAFDLVWRQRAMPAEALAAVKTRMSPRLDRLNTQWERIAEGRRREWESRQ
jgi:ABC-type glycerol-3-phosphate transport system substrate-binding protein